MTTINHSLWIGRDALVAHQGAIAVTGQNISNVNTPGYSRQRIVLETKAPMTAYPEGMIGNGVYLKTVQRVYDRFLNNRLNTALQDQHRWEARQSVVQQVEAVFQETEETGLSSRIGGFFNAWQDIASNPTGYAERLTVIGKAKDLALGLKQAYDSLTSLQRETDAQIRDGVNAVNSLATNLNALNDQIVRMKQRGQNPNDLEDKRDAMLADLAEYVDFTTNESSEGLVTVTLADGKVLVGRPPEGKLVAVDDADGLAKIAWSSDPGTPITGQIGSGKMKGWIESRDGTIQNGLDRMDALAKAIRDAVNPLHQAGKGLDGVGGRDFFIGTGASDLAVHPDIEANPTWIAAASADAIDGTLAADNRNALAMAALVNQAVSDLGSATFSQYAAWSAAQVGQDVRNASQNLSYQKAVVSQLQNVRDSISGVSLDEEMANLIQYQHAYAASARMITTVNQMMQDLVTMV